MMMMSWADQARHFRQGKPSPLSLSPFTIRRPFHSLSTFQFHTTRSLPSSNFPITTPFPVFPPFLILLFHALESGIACLRLSKVERVWLVLVRLFCAPRLGRLLRPWATALPLCLPLVTPLWWWWWWFRDSRDKMDGHRARVFCVIYHPREQNVLLTGGWDDTVQFWDDRSRHSFRSAP